MSIYEEQDITTASSVAPSIHRSDSVPRRDVSVLLSHVTSRLENQPSPTKSKPDIEHVVVQDDPRLWSKKRKAFTLAIVAVAAVIATLGVNIYNPAINDIKAELHATDQEISLSLSLFLLFQGVTPLLWSAISEIRGRKVVYLASISMCLIGCGIAAVAKSTTVLILMRVVQSSGGGAVSAIGAATLADIYEPSERGTMVGIYYAAPLLGPAIGPLIGGVVTQLLSWRATFYFLVIFAGLSLLSFVFFKDTFRRQRSLSYQSATRQRDEKLRAKEKALQLEDDETETETETEKSGTTPTDLEAQPHLDTPTPTETHLSFLDINPIRPIGSVLKRRNNLVILFPSACISALSYCITYTAVRTFSAAPYLYNALDMGLILLFFGLGNMGGSVLGGRWSDHVLSGLKAAKGGKTSSEDRLQSTKPMMLLLSPALVAYAWSAEKKVHISAICVLLFLIGFASIWIYSSTLAYIVDANVGRSSTAAATNSCFRGISGFIAVEAAVSLQNTMGDGGLYTLWGGLMAVACLMILLTIAKGEQWRERAEENEWKKLTTNN